MPELRPHSLGTATPSGPDLLDTAACAHGGPSPPPPASVTARLAAAAAQARAAAAAVAAGARLPGPAGGVATDPPPPPVTVPVLPPLPRPPRPPPGPGRRPMGGAGPIDGITTAMGGAPPGPLTAPLAAPPRPPRAGGGAGGVTLKALIDAGMISPGEGVLSVEYKNVVTLGSLDGDGRITTIIDGAAATFDSPSAFSIYLKRLVNPARKADDGWKTVKFGGRYLEHFKSALIRSRGGGGVDTDVSASPGGSSLPSKRANVHGGDGGSGSASASESADGSTGRARRRARLGATTTRRGPPLPPPAAAAHGDDHDMRPLEEYGAGLPGTPGAPPFALAVAPSALAVLDTHAHLSLHEVGGLLVGTYDPATRSLTVTGALPVAEIGAGSGRTDVEFDPEAEWAARTAIDARGGGARVVGWYHSHPTFAPLPSGIDVANQAAQQAAHGGGGGGSDAGVSGGGGSDAGDTHPAPFVGAIVAPYDAATRSARRGGCVAEVAWFRVEPHAGSARAVAAAGGGAGVLKRLRPAAPAAAGDVAAALDTLLPSDTLTALAARYAAAPHRAPLLGPWPAAGAGAANGGGAPSTRLEKLRASIASRLAPLAAPVDAVDAVLDRVVGVLQRAWTEGASNGMKKE